MSQQFAFYGRAWFTVSDNLFFFRMNHIDITLSHNLNGRDGTKDAEDMHLVVHADRGRTCTRRAEEKSSENYATMAQIKLYLMMDGNYGNNSEAH